MIRDARAYVAVSTVGALGSLVVFIANLVNPPLHGFFPVWFPTGIALFLVCYFIYTICMTLAGRPIPRTSWESNLTDGQLWTIAAILIATVALASAAIILARLP